MRIDVDTELAIGDLRWLIRRRIFTRLWVVEWRCKVVSCVLHIDHYRCKRRVSCRYIVATPDGCNPAFVDVDASRLLKTKAGAKKACDFRNLKIAGASDAPYEEWFFMQEED